MYENISISDISEFRQINWTPILYTSLFLLRRLSLGFFTFFAQEIVYVTIFIYMYSSLLSLSHALQTKAIFASPEMNFLNRVNEAFVLITSYFLISFI